MNNSHDIEIQYFHPPTDTHEVVSLLWHKGPPWVEDVRRRLTGELPGAGDHFWLARQQGAPVAHVWYSTAETNPAIGILGHVYTLPAFRRQGISSRLLAHAMRHFRVGGGRLMQLFTSTPFSVPFYEKHGFENLYENQAYHETDWYMRWPPESETLVQNWYEAQPAAIRQLAAGDLPAYCLLYNTEFTTRLKDRAQEIGLGLEAELAFIRMWERIAQGQGSCYVLANDHVIAAVGSLVPLEFPHQAHVALADVYLHPQFVPQAGQLMEHCLASRDQLGIERVLALAADESKSQLLRELGFRRVAELTGLYKIREQRFDCELFELP